MQNQKKSHNKQNSCQMKNMYCSSTNPLQLQQLQYPQIQQKLSFKSSQLKKTQKRPISQKTRCVSGKPSLNKTINMKDFLKRFRSLKAIAQKEKSPISIKSKSRNKKGTKKTLNNSLKPNQISQLNLTLKLQRTLKKLNENGFFRSEDDELLLQTSCDPQSVLGQIVPQPQPDYAQEWLNINQLKYFCSRNHIVNKRKLDFFRGDMYECMAIRIQRAWRRYQTNNLVSRYIFKSNLHDQHKDNKIVKVQKYQNVREENKQLKQQIKPQHKESLSSDSQIACKGFNDFNSKKYIDYLDGDIYNNSKQNPNRTISLKQQEHFIKLINRTKDYAMKLGQSELYRPQSQIANPLQIDQNSKIKKCISEKGFKKRRENTFQNKIDLYEDLNFDMLAKQFLEGDDLYDSIQKKKLKLNKKQNEIMRNFQNDDEFDFNQKEQDQPQRDRHMAPTLKRQLNQRIVIQTIDKTMIQIDEGQQFSMLGTNEVNYQKADHITSMIINTMQFQFAKQVSQCSSTIFQKCKDYIFKKTNSKQIQRMRKNDGFRTNLAEVKDFISGLSHYIFAQEPNLFKNIEIPVGPTAIQMLGYMHPIQENQRSISKSDDQSDMVLPSRIFDEYWKICSQIIDLENQQKISNSSNFLKRLEIIKGLKKIFYQSLFDAFNQCLDLQRNYGQFGKPFPWKNAGFFSHKLSQSQIKYRIEKAEKKMNEISSMYCGLIVEGQQLIEINSNQGYLQQIQQDRISRMLASDLIENQDRWVFYDDQEAQTLIQLSYVIAFQLIIECLEQLCHMFQ